MARTDAIVLGAGIVGTSIALHLAKRGLSVALIDRAGVGEQTSYGNAGIIEGNTIFPPAFPADLGALLRIALKRAQRGELPPVVSAAGRCPGCWRFAPPRGPERLAETARLIRPLFARAVAEHEALMAEAGAAHYPAQDRLAQALSQRTQLCGACGASSISPRNSACRCRRSTPRRAGARAVAAAGVRACGVLAAGGEREQSARR